MRPCRFVLLVEDDLDQIGTWEAEFREFNQDSGNPFKLGLKTATNLREARKILQRCYINAAIVDLRIPAGGEGSADGDTGNTALREIISTISGPTAVFSGHIGDIDESVTNNTPIRLFRKESQEFSAVFGWLCEHAQLMTAVDETIFDIRLEAAQVFFGMIWRRWNETKELDLPAETLRKVVTRQVIAHVAEQLSLPLNDAPPYHPYEYYFDPPLRVDRMHTGDLLSLHDGVYVILSPQCDMVREYPEKVLLAKCKEIQAWDKVGKKKKKEYATQGHAIKSHFIPPCGGRGPWLVDFKCLITIDEGRIDEKKATRFASIAPQFIPNLIQRFTAFLGRVGQPEVEL